MRLAFLGLFLILGCAGGDVADLVPGPEGRRFAVVRPVSHHAECSSIGGDHWVLEIDEPGRKQPRYAHAGGHGVQLPLPSAYYVAELKMVPPPARDEPDPDCIGRLPTFVASTFRMVEAPDLEAARRLLAVVAERGMPPLSAVLGASDAAEEIAVARIGRGNEPFQLESIEGHAPATIELRWTRRFQPMYGDYLVVARAGDRVARVLLAEDRAAALRWAAWARRDGWPPAVLDASDEGSRETRRWTWVGAVVEGRPGCGPRIAGPWAYAEHDPWSAAAPAGVPIGQTVTAVMVGRFERDACGHDMRTVRVYPGQMQFRDGSPTPLFD